MKPGALAKGVARVVFPLAALALCLGVELSEEQHENLPDFGDPKVCSGCAMWCVPQKASSGLQSSRH